MNWKINNISEFVPQRKSSDCKTIQISHRIRPSRQHSVYKSTGTESERPKKLVVSENTVVMGFFLFYNFYVRVAAFIQAFPVLYLYDLTHDVYMNILVGLRKFKTQECMTQRPLGRVGCPDPRVRLRKNSFKTSLMYLLVH